MKMSLYKHTISYALWRIIVKDHGIKISGPHGTVRVNYTYELYSHVLNNKPIHIAERDELCIALCDLSAITINWINPNRDLF